MKQTIGRLALGLLLGSSSLQAAEPVLCTIRDDSPAGGQNTQANSLAQTAISSKEIVGDNQKKLVLRDPNYSVQVARYVGQIQIIVIDNKTRKNVLIASTPDTAFSGLELTSYLPNVNVSCQPSPQAQDVKTEGK